MRSRLPPLVLLCCAPVLAQDTVIYRCTAANGAVTLQNDRPCPAGTRQEMRRVGALPAAPPPTAAAPATSRPPPPEAQFELVRGPLQAPASPAPAADAPPRPPPPPLFLCRSWDNDDYFSDTATPEPRCVPLATVGIGGDPRLGAGSACEVRTDTCTAVPAGALCRAWRQRVDEAEFRWKFAGAGDTDPRKAEYERLAQVLRGSACAP